MADPKTKTKKIKKNSGVKNQEIYELCIKIDKTMVQLSKLLKINSNVTNIIEIIKQNKMVQFYKTQICSLQKSGEVRAISFAELSAMETAHLNQIKEIDDQLEEEDSSLDIYEKRYLNLKKAKLYALYGDKENALTTYEKALELSTTPNKKISVIFDTIKMRLFYGDYASLEKLYKQLDELKIKTIDWEKRNHLKVYEATRFLIKGDFSAAASLCSETLATFASDDIFPFNDLVFYAVVTGVVSFTRTELNKKIVNSPEIVSTIAQIPHLKNFLDSIYECKYELFFPALLGLKQKFAHDRFLSPHYPAFLTAAKKVAYNQYLESYLSVKLDSLSASFGVSPSQIDSDLFHFISNDQLPAEVDKTFSVVYRRPKDCSSRSFASIARHGDALSSKTRRFWNALAA